MDVKSSVIKQAIVSTILLAVMMTVFYASAGRTDIPRSWLLFSVSFINFVGSALVLARYNPKLLIQRLTIRRKGSKAWDEVLMRVSNLTGLLLVPMVAGLDVGRYGWSSLGILYTVLGLIMMAASSVLTNWAMIENPHFEPTVRIQEDREHQVVSTGPYRIMRHPGYLSGIMWMSSIPLVLGSLYTLVPIALYSALMILRTQLEDRTLQEELTGYTEYTEKVRYKLFPGVW